LSSAQRATKSASNTKRNCSRPPHNFGTNVLREVESVANSEGAIRNVRTKFDAGWTNERIGNWLETSSSTTMSSCSTVRIAALFDDRRNSPTRNGLTRRPPIPPCSLTCAAATPICQRNPPDRIAGPVAPRIRKRVVRRLLGRPAVIAAVTVGTIDAPRRGGEHRADLMSVKLSTTTYCQASRCNCA